jgi:putative addiction module component (TIGR02574 family)
VGGNDLCSEGRYAEKGDITKRIDLALSELSFTEKLNLMEALWADLCRDEEKLKSPAWHEAVLKDRAEAYAAGKVNVSDWEQTKRRLDLITETQ